MDSTLKALATLAVQAIPTVVFFIFLTFYLKRVYFLPVSRILEERRRQTDGVRDLARRAHEAADQKTSEFETAIQLVAHNSCRRTKDCAANGPTSILKRSPTPRGGRQQMTDAKAQIARELEAARSEIDSSVDRLSSQIVDSLLKRRAA